MKFHPDKNKHDKAEEAFKRVSAAYKVLSDPTKKRRYDQDPDINIFDVQHRPNSQRGFNGGFYE